MENLKSVWPPVKTGLTIILTLTFFVVLGWNLEIGHDFEQARASLGPNHYGMGMAQSLAQLIVENELAGDVLNAFPGANAPLLSTTIVGADDHRPEWPLLSLVVIPHDLYDAATGIMSNALQRGRAWERTGQVSYFEDGVEILSGRVGVRMHGGDSRRALGNTPMFRLYFRDRYRPDPNRPSVLHGAGREAAARWVIRHPPHTNFYANAFAFEIARRNGALTPAFQPVRFFLNGDYSGDYLLTEQVNRAGWGRSYFGHDDYLLYVYRDAGDAHEESATAYLELQRWANDPDVDMTLEEASRRIDMENFSRHLLTFAFAGERDPYQGAAFRNERIPGSRWQWLHYDLDQSFTRNETLPPEIDWQKPGFELFTSYLTGERGTDIRAVLFRRLILDPVFRDYFTDLVLGLLNHSIDQAFLQDLVGRYAYTGGPRRNFSNIDLAEFLRRRPAWVVRDLEAVVGAGPIHEVTVESAEHTAIEVDGHAKGDGGYRGWYRDGQAIELSFTGEPDGFSHWLVNGEAIEGRQLILAITAPTTIVPVDN